jgi:hypothetical protein
MSPEFRPTRDVLGMGSLAGQAQATVSPAIRKGSMRAPGRRNAWSTRCLHWGRRPAELMDTAEGRALVSNLARTHARRELRVTVALWRIGIDTPDYRSSMVAARQSSMPIRRVIAAATP